MELLTIILLIIIGILAFLLLKKERVLGIKTDENKTEEQVKVIESKDYRKNILKYGNVIDLDGKGPHGTHLGGTGIAVSNISKYKDIALEYSYWIAGADCQQTIFYTSGGQPGNSDAWENNKINLETNNFFKNTFKILDIFTRVLIFKTTPNTINRSLLIFKKIC